jgi:hypothetical protein
MISTWCVFYILGGWLTVDAPAGGGVGLITKVYSVEDLVGPDRGRGTAEEELLTLVTQVGAAGSWSHTGGPGTVDYFSLTQGLVVTQTPETQEQIIKMLEALRAWRAKLDPRNKL